MGGALPAAVAHMGHRVATVMPLYQGVERKLHGIKDSGKRLHVNVGGRTVEAALWRATTPHGDDWFIEHAPYFDRPRPYGDASGDYPDNAERFSFFCAAALALAESIGAGIVHAHDWQAGLIPSLAAAARKSGSKTPGTVFTIHNMAYQGLFDMAEQSVTGLPPDFFGMDGLEFHGRINFLKGGMVHADQVTTVSRTYAEEIRTAEHGCGLDGVATALGPRLSGIVNGLDPDEWNPATDPDLAAPFSADNLKGRAVGRKAVQDEMGLTDGPAPLVGMVGRLVEQKGLALVLEVLPTLLAGGARLAVLGSGDAAIEKRLQQAADHHPGQVALALGYDEGLARRIYAGADLFLMPSRFEPCGLSQQIAMRYGAVPVVSRVGGLVDTVVPDAPRKRSATGFAFSPFSADALASCLKQAFTRFAKGAPFARIQQNGMRRDVSWDRSAEAYESVYRKAAKEAGKAPNW